MEYDRFDFSYDGLDRLTAADHIPQPGIGAEEGRGSSASAYDVAGITYDPNGNIRTMTRRDRTGAVIDQLSYGYGRSNRLAQITDAAFGGAVSPAAWDAETGAFAYDPNGNATSLPAPYSVAVQYDHRNLPTRLSRGVETVARHRYAATGQRYLRMVGGETAVATERQAAAPGAAVEAARTAEGVTRGAMPRAGAATRAAEASSAASAEGAAERGSAFGGVQRAGFAEAGRTADQIGAATERVPGGTAPGAVEVGAAPATPGVAEPPGAGRVAEARRGPPLVGREARDAAGGAAPVPGAPAAVGPAEADRLAQASSPTSGQYYLALDGLERTGTQPTVAEVSVE